MTNLERALLAVVAVHRPQILPDGQLPPAVMEELKREDWVREADFYGGKMTGFTAAGHDRLKARILFALEGCQ